MKLQRGRSSSRPDSAPASSTIRPWPKTQNWHESKNNQFQITKLPVPGFLTCDAGPSTRILPRARDDEGPASNKAGLEKEGNNNFLISVSWGLGDGSMHSAEGLHKVLSGVLASGHLIRSSQGSHV